MSEVKVRVTTKDGKQSKSMDYSRVNHNELMAMAYPPAKFTLMKVEDMKLEDENAD